MPFGTGFLFKEGMKKKGDDFMENKISVISIIVQEKEASGAINSLLHEFGQYIVGRMGLPYRERNVSIICIVLDAPSNVTSALSGKLGMIKGVSTKTITAKQND